MKNLKLDRRKIAITGKNHDSRDSGGTAVAAKSTKEMFLASLPMTTTEMGINFCDAKCWHDYLFEFDSMRDAVFARKAYDLLITSGSANRSKTNADRIEREAFEKIGLVDLHKVHNLENYLRLSKKKKITIFAMCSEELFRCLSLPEFGFVLAFMINYDAGVYH